MWTRNYLQLKVPHSPLARILYVLISISLLPCIFLLIYQFNKAATFGLDCDVVASQNLNNFTSFFFTKFNIPSFCANETRSRFGFVFCVGRLSWQILLHKIRLARQMLRFTFGRNGKTHSWLHEKFIVIKFTTCSLKRDARRAQKKYINFHRVSIASEICTSARFDWNTFRWTNYVQ